MLNQEYHDEEYLKEEFGSVNDDEVNDFVMKDKHEEVEDDFFTSNLPKAIKAGGNRGNKLTATDEGNPGSEFDLYTNKKQVTLVKKPNNYVEEDKKDLYGTNEGFASPKSPRNKKRTVILGESVSGISHGRRGTNTFYQNS